MNKYQVFFIIVFINLFSIAYSQRLTISESCGINFSNINNSSLDGRWKSMPGALAGISVNYKISKVFSVGSGIDYISLYYNYSDYSIPNLGPYPDNYIMPWYTVQKQDWSFSYLRLPLILSLRTPGRFNYNVLAGAFYSKLIGNNSQHWEQEPPSFDYGFMFGNGLSYHLDNQMNLNFNMSYVVGKKVMIEQDNGRNAAIEMSLGVGYTFKSKSNKDFIIKDIQDSLTPILVLKYSVGPLLGINVGDNRGKYKPGMGISTGASLIYQKPQGVSFEADILYQRVSYALNDSSSSFFYFDPSNIQYYTDTKTDLDYISLPVLINLTFGKKENIYAGLGLYGSVQLNARVVGTAYTKSSSESYLVENKYHVYNSIDGNFFDYDAGWIFNCGFETRLFKKFKMDFNLRYNASFVNIYKNENEGIIKLKSLNVNAGIIIPIH